MSGRFPHPEGEGIGTPEPSRRMIRTGVPLTISMGNRPMPPNPFPESLTETPPPIPPPRPPQYWLRDKNTWENVAEEVWRRPDDHRANQYQSEAIGPDEILPKNQMDWFTYWTSSERCGWGEGRAASKFRNITFFKSLGKGIAGQVWQASAWKNFAEYVTMACKVIRKGIGDALLVKDMLIDMRVLLRVNHENIVKMLDFVIIPDPVLKYPFASALLFMELCDGTAKDVFLAYPEGEPALEDVCKHFFRQFAEAIRYLHSIKITHGDAHAGNILFVSPLDKPLEGDLDENVMAMTFKLSDFGRSTIFPVEMTDQEMEEFKEKKEKDVASMTFGLQLAMLGQDLDFLVPEDTWWMMGKDPLFVDLQTLMWDKLITADEVLVHQWLTEENQ